MSLHNSTKNAPRRRHERRTTRPRRPHTITLDEIERAKELIAQRDFPWCRALLFHALAGAARKIDRDSGESVLREVLDEIGLDDEIIAEIVNHFEIGGVDCERRIEVSRRERVVHFEDEARTAARAGFGAQALCATGLIAPLLTTDEKVTCKSCLETDRVATLVRARERMDVMQRTTNAARAAVAAATAEWREPTPECEVASEFCSGQAVSMYRGKKRGEPVFACCIACAAIMSRHGGDFFEDLPAREYDYYARTFMIERIVALERAAATLGLRTVSREAGTLRGRLRADRERVWNL